MYIILCEHHNGRGIDVLITIFEPGQRKNLSFRQYSSRIIYFYHNNNNISVRSLHVVDAFHFQSSPSYDGTLIKIISIWKQQ